MAHVAGGVEDFDRDVAVYEILAFFDGLNSLERLGGDFGSLLGVVVEAARCELVPELLGFGESIGVGLGYDGGCSFFDELSPRPDDISAAVREQDHLSLFDFPGRVAIDDNAGVDLFDDHAVDRACY